MTEKPIEQFTIAELTVKIYQDTESESPNTWGDDGLFLAAFHRDFDVQPKGFDQERVVEALESPKAEPDYHVFPLEAYIHGGVVLALGREGNFPDLQWDVPQLGAVFVSKKEAQTKAKARKLALGLMETWNQYLSGDVYGYVIEDSKGEHLDSCWGFYGLDECKAEATSAAKYEAKRILKEHVAKKKAEIEHHVPLNRRTA